MKEHTVKSFRHLLLLFTLAPVLALALDGKAIRRALNQGDNTRVIVRAWAWAWAWASQRCLLVER